MLDMFPMDGSDPAQNYKTIRRELEAFSPTLAQKRELIAANKMDLAIDDDALDRLKGELPDKQIFPISGASHKGVEHLLEALWKILLEMKPEKRGGAAMAWPATLKVALKEWASVCSAGARTTDDPAPQGRHLRSGGGV